MNGKTSDSNDMNGRVGQDLCEGYERQPTTTQGEDRHHGSTCFFILQNPKNIDKRSRSSRCCH